MGEFFRSWKRKVGVVTLVMACVFLGMWVRSQAMWDRLSDFNETWCIKMESFNGLVGWHFTTVVDKRSTYSLYPPKSGHRQVAASQMPGSLLPFGHDLSSCGWQLQCHWETSECAFVIATKENVKMFVLILSYWFIVLPLTALSAWLLLSKHQKSAQKKIVGPVESAYTSA
jgi:hypothetical protein